MSKTKIISSAILATAVLATGLALPTAASAKDWVEKVEVTRDGIDFKPIEVSANKNGYTGIKSKNHKFLLGLYARATSGERIVAMKVGASGGVKYFESDDNRWTQDFSNRDVGAGSKRTVSIHYDATLPINKIYWFGPNPKQACDINLKRMMQKGAKKHQVLNQPQEIRAYAYFELDAVAARKNKAAKGWNMYNTTNQRDGYNYEVRVICNASGAKVGS
ncbi:hypothetical protein WNZ14_09595 [Hoeflea sp. AS60]|uniref:hypothetical protein n=1 Tax=Hoeflea sp. AS60 TaxID=3135780 RepID=UPI0031700D6A